MNIAFKPTIPEFFSSSTASTESGIKKAPKPYVSKKAIRKPWLTSEITSLIELRALSVPYRDIGFILKRRSSCCSTAVFSHRLQEAIRNRRKVLIGKAHAYRALEE